MRIFLNAAVFFKNKTRLLKWSTLQDTVTPSGSLYKCNHPPVKVGQTQTLDMTRWARICFIHKLPEWRWRLKNKLWQLLGQSKSTFVGATFGHSAMVGALFFPSSDSFFGSKNICGCPSLVEGEGNHNDKSNPPRQFRLQCSFMDICKRKRSIIYKSKPSLKINWAWSIFLSPVV